MSLAAIFVHYHAADWLATAVCSLRADLERDGLEAEVVVVDNGSRPSERERLQTLGVAYVDAGGNRGYASALNLGIAVAKAEYLFLLNPDIEVLPHCCSALLAALAQGAAVAGPRLYWDRAQRMLLPPTERRTRSSELLRVCAPFHPRLASLARRRWRRHAHAHWLTSGTLTSWTLSGAFLGVRRDALARIGPFDEGFKLYFEETDWLERARRRGLQSCLVSSARAVHFYNQSAAREPAAPDWFTESARRFERRHYGAWFVRAKAKVAAWGRVAPDGWPCPSEGIPTIDLNGLSPSGSRPAWLEISPSPLGFPAAAEPLAHPGSGHWTLPADVWQHLAPGSYHGRGVDTFGREPFAFSFIRPRA
jgi:N-acetylglucosaminyl-diphospho-decaprenol L-rhamnosyltransferase